eukprot:1650153-Pyramimonas_sp.AAC.1
MGGILWALLWIGLLGQHEAEGFVIESDSVSAIQIAERSAQSSAHPEFGATLRHLVVDLRA